MAMTVTFDTNTIEKASRQDDEQANFARVRAAIKAGDVVGHFSETIITLEGIQRKDRANVFNSTYLRRESTKERLSDKVATIEVHYFVEQPTRQSLRPRHAARITAALAVGMKVLRAPRIGMFHLADPDGKYFVGESEQKRAERIDRYHVVGREIEAYGAGFAVVKNLGAKFAARENKKQELWFHSLTLARNVHEKNEVERATAEWADADSVAAHVGYGLDIFCTDDAGKSAGGISVLNPINQTWLKTKYGVKFVTISDLEGML